LTLSDGPPTLAVVRREREGVVAGKRCGANWSNLWLRAWGVVAVTLIVLVFTPVLSFVQWAVAAGIGFGTMEGLGLWHPDDPYPPLTHVIRCYVPRWAAFPALYGITAAAGAVWVKYAHPVRIGLLFSLLGWLTTHFDTAFDETAERREQEKLDATPGLRVLSPRIRAAHRFQRGLEQQRSRSQG